MRPRVYLSATGQRDNIGDALLRRGLIASLRATGAVDLHVLLGDLRPDYVAGLYLDPSDRLYPSGGRWRAGLLLDALRGRAAYAFNAGEINNSPEKPFSKRPGRIARIANRFGRGSYWTGIGVRRPDLAPTPEMSYCLDAFRLVSWRDRPSREFGGTGELHPDWGFAEGTASTAFPGRTSRKRVAISLRGDREAPGPEWFEAIASVCSTLSLDPVVVVQVRRDGDRAIEVSERLGAELVSWPDTDDFAVQEERLREVYRGCAAVLGDRLHAVIMGATEGAVPIGFTVTSAEKIDRTLDLAGFGGSAWSSADVPAEESAQRIAALISGVDSVPARIESVREELRLLARSIVTTIA